MSAGCRISYRLSDSNAAATQIVAAEGRPSLHEHWLSVLCLSAEEFQSVRQQARYHF